MTFQEFLEQCRPLIGIAVSLVLGFAIGYERKSRAKEAGIRTHTIVCAGSALLMAVSTFVAGSEGDPGRIAAQVVSGIGFLGAGIIIYRQNEIHGLTTAAGVWATAGVGLAAGAGMYVVAVGATAMVIATQYILHTNLKVFKRKRYYRFRVQYVEGEAKAEDIKNLFGVSSFTDFDIKKTEEGLIYTAILETDKEIAPEELTKIIKETPSIIALEFCEDD